MNEVFWLTHCYHLTLTLIMFLTSHPYNQKLKNVRALIIMNTNFLPIYSNIFRYQVLSGSFT